MDYKMDELILIAAELVKKYTGGESTSVTYEKAQMIMSGIIYCLNEYENYLKSGLADKILPAEERYQIGKKIVREKAIEIKKIYNEMSLYFEHYDVDCLRDAVQKELPEFMKWYDAEYFPQNTLQTLDYPLLLDLHSLSGVDAVYTYICAIKMEQLFLRKFERYYITETLRKINPEYKHMIENVSEIVLLNIAGHIVLGKPIHKIGFTVREYEELKKIFQSDSIAEIENTLNTIIKNMIEQIYEGNQEMLRYFGSGVKNMAVRIDNAVKSEQLDKIWAKTSFCDFTNHSS